MLLDLLAAALLLVAMIAAAFLFLAGALLALGLTVMTADRANRWIGGRR